MRRGVMSAVGLSLALGVAGCSLGSNDTSISTTLPPLGPTEFRTIPTTATTLSPVADAGSAGGGTVTGEQLYTIQAGDYPLKIVAMFGCQSWEQIQNYNELTAFPFPSVEIKIPATCGQTTTTTTTAAGGGQTQSSAPADQTTTTAAAGGGGATTYTVVAGDTVYGIAAKFDVTPSALAQANGWSDGVSHSIFPGDSIVIP